MNKLLPNSANCLQEFCFEKFIRCTNNFPPFFIKNWAFIAKERNLMFYSKFSPSYCSSCDWHESSPNNASYSASSHTFGLQLRSLSSMSNSPFLNFWKHSRIGVRLSDFTSALSAELYAVFCTLKHVYQLQALSAVIFNDSLFSLYHLRDRLSSFRVSPYSFGSVGARLDLPGCHRMLASRVMRWLTPSLDPLRTSPS